MMDDNTLFIDEEIQTPDIDKLLPPDREYTRFESVFAWFCVLVGYLICRAFPPSVYSLGCCLVVAITLTLSVVSLVKKRVKIKPVSLFPLSACVCFGVSFVTSGDEMSLFLSVLGSVVCYSLFVYLANGHKIENAESDFIIFDIYRAMKGLTSAGSKDMLKIMFSGRKKTLFAILKILAGIFIAVIPTAIIITLLSFDENFSAMLGNIGKFFDNFNLISHIFSLAIGLLIGCYIFGLYKINTEARTDDETEKRKEQLKSVRIAPSLTVAVALLPIVAVYIIFFVSQWDYYVSGFSGTLPEGVYNYAEYARDGFFELCCVSAINLVILIAVGFLLKRDRYAETLLLKCVNLVFSAMTLVLIGTALSKMALYIDVYGLTEKRVLSSWLMILLALLFIAIIIAQFVPKMKLITVSVIIVCIASAVLTLADYRTIIANYNVDKYISGDIKEVRMSDLMALGDSAVPATVRLLEYYENNIVVPSYERENAAEYLRARRDGLEETNGLFKLSLPKYRAANSLEEYFDSKG